MGAFELVAGHLPGQAPARYLGSEARQNAIGDSDANRVTAIGVRGNIGFVRPEHSFKKSSMKAQAILRKIPFIIAIALSILGERPPIAHKRPPNPDVLI